MDFEYNGNLLEDDRINLVANEIVDKYPQISLENAKKAAMFEGRISDDKTIDDELNRLYNIMLVNSDNKEIVAVVFKDFLEILKSNSIQDDANCYIKIVDGINAYFQNNAEFPLLGDYQ